MSINLYSSKDEDIQNFLSSFYNKKVILSNNFKFKISFEDPIEMADMIGIFIENNEKYKINMWITLDDRVFIYVTEHNVDKLIRYLYERFPY